MYNKFCCPKCGNMFLNFMRWETFVDSNGIIINKASLIYTCCSNRERVAIGEDFDWKEWAAFVDFKDNIEGNFWEMLRDKLGGH